ncbi:hypothetical protein [Pelagicoccus sp. SDUM812005]|uniref:hypothetical protein n=1 Tax=Pelagicoccus sp. SDUM812005 TaxID=3041257 RepID=UPI00280E5FD6|nr:hypothetical protein [Pelagicoccus sp. SDUM812005]MDQ8180668.1 hypothetical protein [Pelagicoccus sp. SDUM812005]
MYRKRFRRSLRSKRGGVLKSALALLTVLSAGGVLGWMLLMPDAVQLEIEARTGFPAEAESMAINPVGGLSIDGKKLTIGNPGAYGGGDAMLEIESIKGSASLSSLGRGEIWLYELEMHISRATLVVNENGRLNLDVFASRLFADPATGAQLPFFAEKVRLVVDEVVFVDNSKIIPSRHGIRAMLDSERADLEQSRDLFGPLFELARGVGALPVP